MKLCGQPADGAQRTAAGHDEPGDTRHFSRVRIQNSFPENETVIYTKRDKIYYVLIFCQNCAESIADCMSFPARNLGDEYLTMPSL